MAGIDGIYAGIMARGQGHPVPLGVNKDTSSRQGRQLRCCESAAVVLSSGQERGFRPSGRAVRSMKGEML